MKNDEGVESRNQKEIDSFVEYCLDHPEQRFWQALRNWSDNSYVLTASGYDFSRKTYTGIKDTFYK